jgi:LmbE family N-acetylglucosaminyl deacetylase
MGRGRLGQGRFRISPKPALSCDSHESGRQAAPGWDFSDISMPVVARADAAAEHARRTARSASPSQLVAAIRAESPQDSVLDGTTVGAEAHDLLAEIRERVAEVLDRDGGCATENKPWGTATSRSCRQALVTVITRSRPRVFTTWCRLRPVTFLPPS